MGSYGGGHKNTPANLKTNRSGSDLTDKDPITVTYSKTERTVKFTSKNFDYSQKNLPQKDFALSISQC